MLSQVFIAQPTEGGLASGCVLSPERLQMYQQVEGTGVDLGDPVPISQGPLSISIPRDPVVPSQKVRLDPPGTYIAVSPITVPEKVRLDP